MHTINELIICKCLLKKVLRAKKLLAKNISIFSKTETTEQIFGKQKSLDELENHYRNKINFLTTDSADSI